MEIEEIWRDIPEYIGIYQASNLGRIRSLDRIIKYSNNGTKFLKGIILKPSLLGQYYRVNLWENHRQKTFRIHQLVAITFLNHKPDGTHDLEVDHINQKKTDNRLSNLRVVTHSVNMRNIIRV
jgi:hypothetical protein